MKPRLPIVTLLVVGVALIVALVPKLAAVLIYDRAAILSGEVWRIFTGHWVHLTTRHLFCDLAVLGIAGWIIESKQLPMFGWLCVLSAWSGGVAMLALDPGMSRYAGLSGVALAALVYLGLCGWCERTNWRWWNALLLVGVIGKISAELISGSMAFSGVATGAVRVATTSHIAGVVTAALFFCGLKFVRHRESGPLQITAPGSG